METTHRITYEIARLNLKRRFKALKWRDSKHGVPCTLLEAHPSHALCQFTGHGSVSGRDKVPYNDLKYWLSGNQGLPLKLPLETPVLRPTPTPTRIPTPTPAPDPRPARPEQRPPTPDPAVLRERIAKLVKDRAELKAMLLQNEQEAISILELLDSMTKELRESLHEDPT